MKLERIIEITPAFDKRHLDPSKNYGIGSCVIRMVLKGPKGAYQFILDTGWDLPHVQEYLVKEHDQPKNYCRNPMPADVGYHSSKPMYEGQTQMSGKCEFVEGGKCYYDGSTLHANSVYLMLLEGGSEKVWQYLEKLYKEELEK